MDYFTAAFLPDQDEISRLRVQLHQDLCKRADINPEEEVTQ